MLGIASRFAKRQLARNSIATRAILKPYQLTLIVRYLGPSARSAWQWLWQSREITNLTYDLTPTNKRYLSHFVSIVAQIPFSAAEAYLEELAQDTSLKAYLTERYRASNYQNIGDETPLYARRLGWYALVRALKPEVVVETGIDKGLGSVVLCAALLRNREDGYPGHYYGTDVNPEAGFLLAGPYAEVGTILYGDSIEALAKLTRIDLFINDSDHSAEYEAREYETIAPLLSDRAIILGDNSHVTDSLVNFAERTQRRFLFFREAPEAHWYPGAGIGICY
jgi:cephalosporin hydroxylase